MSIELIEDEDDQIVDKLNGLQINKPKFPPIEELDLDNLEPSRERALDAKERGNKFFAKGDYENALECYAEALLFVPEEDVEDRAVYHNNKAAAHIMRKEWQDVIDETTTAIHLKQGNVKAYSRRARAFEHLDRMSDALDDYKIVANLEPTKANQRKVEEIEKIVQERFEKQKDEMLGKLKDFGNAILGKFNMSLDQFQATKDPNTGAYSLSFGNKPAASEAKSPSDS